MPSITSKVQENGDKNLESADVITAREIELSSQDVTLQTEENKNIGTALDIRKTIKIKPLNDIDTPSMDVGTAREILKKPLQHLSVESAEDPTADVGTAREILHNAQIHLVPTNIQNIEQIVQPQVQTTVSDSVEQQIIQKVAEEEKLKVEAPLEQKQTKVVESEQPKTVAPVQQEQPNIATPVQQEQPNIVAPVQQEQPNIPAPVQQEQPSIVPPVQKEQPNIAAPVQKEQLNVVVPVQQEKTKEVVSTQQEQPKVDNPVTKEQEKHKEVAPVEKEKSKVEEIKAKEVLSSEKSTSSLPEKKDYDTGKTKSLSEELIKPSPTQPDTLSTSDDKIHKSDNDVNKPSPVIAHIVPSDPIAKSNEIVDVPKLDSKEGVEPSKIRSEKSNMRLERQTEAQVFSSQSKTPEVIKSPDPSKLTAYKASNVGEKKVVMEVKAEKKKEESKPSVVQEKKSSLGCCIS
uniref:Titin n=1 Tax=Parastrongyloides trichosuri TaxID=131310 RepID=A0A0N4ZQS4_PARTI